MNTYVCAPTDASAAARAAAGGITDGFVRVGPDPADIATVEGGLLFAPDWRDTFAPAVAIGPTGEDAGRFVAAALVNPNLVVEVV